MVDAVDADGKRGSRRGAAQSGKRSRGSNADSGAAAVLTVTAMEALFFNVRPAFYASERSVEYPMAWIG